MRTAHFLDFIKLSLPSKSCVLAIIICFPLRRGFVKAGAAESGSTLHEHTAVIHTDKALTRGLHHGALGVRSLAAALMWIRDSKASEQHVQDTDSFTLIRLMFSLPSCMAGKVRERAQQASPLRPTNYQALHKLELSSHSKIYWT